MSKSEMVENVKELINAPSCCAELKAIGEAWLKAVGTPGEKAMSEKLIDELNADVQTIDEVIDLFSSAAGQKLVGVETAAQMVAHFKEVKAAGGKWCDCPACKIGRSILDNKEVLF
ncbi:MAG: heat-shock protein Hsp90 [Selenomonas sp.]|uniref:heat-shock protein Hsp90 n=1 Tax=Selenomonas sp. TaxID=2053611 RepID=UPI0025E3469A|nr:heat-shock protein Hsp90 [Selenomonas sp.]MCR5438624.1 heat-shock protein Hsp90 [Selenomonas sp.]